jgi:methionyl-tRNA formyltransferase
MLQNQGRSLLELAWNQVERLSQTSTAFPSIADLFQLLKLVQTDNGSQYTPIQSELNKSVQLSLVISQPDQELRGKIISNPVATFARANKIPISLPDKINHHEELFQNLQPDLAVVASYGQILSQKVLDWPKFGMINWHPSKLPLYRGPTPIQTCLVDGQTSTALTWIQMNRCMDAGDILLQIDQFISPTETFASLSQKIGQLGSQTWALVATLQILAKSDPKLFRPQAQDQLHPPTFCQMLNKTDRLIDPAKLTADQIYNRWRGLHQFPGVSFLENKYFKQEIKIVEPGPPTSLDQLNQLIQIHTNSPINQKNQPEIQSQLNQLKLGKTILTLLKTGQGFLPIRKICLENGKTIDFQGLILD